MRRLSLQLVLTALLAVVCIPTIAQEVMPEGPSLSLEEALQLALDAHPSVLAAGQGVEAARATLSGARRPPSPELYIVPTGKIDDASLVGLQALEISGKWGARVRAARAGLGRAEWDREAIRRDLVFQVRTAYADALEAKAVVQLSREALDLVRQVSLAAQRSFELGNVPRSHVVRARVEQARVEQELARAEAELRIRKAALNTAIGRKADTLFSLVGALGFQPLEASLEEQMQRAFARRPEIRAAAASVEAVGHELTVARRDLLPDLLLEGRLEKLTGRGDRPVGLGFTLPFLDWGRRKAEIRRTRAELAGQRALQVQVANEVTLDVEQAVRSLAASRQVVETYEKGIVADAEELMRMAQTGYQEGAMSYLEALDARRALTEARTAYYQALADYQKSVAALQRATGASVP